MSLKEENGNRVSTGAALGASVSSQDLGCSPSESLGFRLCFLGQMLRTSFGRFFFLQWSARSRDLRRRLVTESQIQRKRECGPSLCCQPDKRPVPSTVEYKVGRNGNIYLVRIYVPGSTRIMPSSHSVLHIQSGHEA